MQVTRYSDDVIQAQHIHDGISHQSLMISIQLCAQIVPFYQLNILFSICIIHTTTIIKYLIKLLNSIKNGSLSSDLNVCLISPSLFAISTM